MTGSDPEKTNKFLVSFHKAATSGKNFEKYIKKYKELIDRKAKQEIDLRTKQNLVETEIHKNREKNEEKHVDNEVGSKIKVSRKNVIENKRSSHTVVNNSNSNLKDLESIQNKIREINLNTNPIVKLIDYLPEDIESMNKELLVTINESKVFNEVLEEKLRKSEETLLPLENEYIDLEESIKDEIVRIQSIKSRILNNEIVMKNLMNSVISV